MHISRIEIKNFRRLKECQIDIGEQQTFFVGANNSGKTTAMNALVTFLSPKDFQTQDFTISNWSELNKYGDLWCKAHYDGLSESLDASLDITAWKNYLPSFDIYFNVADHELHHICHLIPSLDWNCGEIGVRLRLEPKNLEKLRSDYTDAYHRARKNAGDRPCKKLYPCDLKHFLDRNKGSNLKTYFEIKYFILDLSSQNTDESVDEFAIDFNPLKGLIRIDTITAQRGFSDANERDIQMESLSQQFQKYYRNHLSPDIEPTTEDIEALEQISNASQSFEDEMVKRFEESLDEIQKMNYPGLDNPSIKLKPSFSMIDGLNHQSSVLFSVDNANEITALPERYNGLGYQNLISMTFKLIGFRDAWMRKGKQSFTTDQNKHFEPIHLVLIEEPEAHLHVQAQQVFVRRAYEILEKNISNDTFSTQLVISTHSSHIAYEVEFANLRYFKREIHPDACIPISRVVNLSNTFGKDVQNRKFVMRYLKTTHYDVFFADALIVVEGAAERMFMPFFLERNSDLSSAYISIMEMMGSHAHRMRPLIDILQIPTLIITDLDATSDNKAVIPCLEQDQSTSNDTLRKWIPRKRSLDRLVALDRDLKRNDHVCVAYQYGKTYSYNDGQQEQELTCIPYTFEDALALENIDLIKTQSKATGLLRKFSDIFNKENPDNFQNKLFDAIRDKGNKAELAMNILFSADIDKLVIPQYIDEGLEWLVEKMKARVKR